MISIFRNAIPLAITTVLLTSVPAIAGPNLNCKAYALVAVAQQKENLKSKCGFKGGRWSQNYNGHLNWCRSPGVKISHISFEVRARKNALVACKKKVTTKGGSSFQVKYCKKAATATQGWRAALKQACKGTGLGTTGEWPKKWKDDFNDCIRKGGSWMDWQNAKRKKQAAACAIKKRTKTFTNKDKLRKKTRYGGLAINECSNSRWDNCGKKWAHELCKGFGYQKVIKIGPIKLNDQRRKKWNSTKADGASTWYAGSRKICYGRCGYFTSITCTK